MRRVRRYEGGLIIPEVRTRRAHETDENPYASDGESDGNEYAEGLGCADAKRCRERAVSGFEFDSNPQERFFREPRTCREVTGSEDEEVVPPLPKKLAFSSASGHSLSNVLSALEREEAGQRQVPDDDELVGYGNLRWQLKQRKREMRWAAERARLGVRPLGERARVDLRPPVRPASSPAVAPKPAVGPRPMGKPAVDPRQGSQPTPAQALLARFASTSQSIPDRSQRPASASVLTFNAGRTVDQSGVVSRPLVKRVQDDVHPPSGLASTHAMASKPSPSQASQVAQASKPTKRDMATTGDAQVRPFGGLGQTPIAVVASPVRKRVAQRPALIVEQKAAVSSGVDESILAELMSCCVALQATRQRHASGFGSSSDDAQALEVLLLLDDRPLNAKLLKATGLGLEVNQKEWKQHAQPEIADVVRTLLARWRSDVLAERRTRVQNCESSLSGA